MTSRELNEFKAALKSFRKNAKTLEQARTVLRKEGVINAKGELRKPYKRTTAGRPAKAS